MDQESGVVFNDGTLRRFSLSFSRTIMGKQRPRFGAGHAYTEDKTRKAEAFLAYQARQQFEGPPLTGALSVEWRITVEIPQSFSAKKRALITAGQCYPTIKPDFDNSTKLLDAFNKLIWDDDARIVDYIFSKRYGINPGAQLTVIVL